MAREVAGVKVRIEVGPEEAEQRSCILAVCSKPGEVAAKSTVQVPVVLRICPDLTDRIINVFRLAVS